MRVHWVMEDIQSVLRLARERSERGERRDRTVGGEDLVEPIQLNSTYSRGSTPNSKGVGSTFLSHTHSTANFRILLKLWCVP